MKNLITILALGYLMNPVLAIAANTKTEKRQYDTISVKCLLYSPDLFHGIELGESPVNGTVDTLLNEIPSYDTSKSVRVVIVSARELGFKGEADITWDEIMDSAKQRGYGICSPQLGPELFVMLQNMPAGRVLLHDHVLKNKPLFVGMDKLRHYSNQEAEHSSFLSFKRRDYNDFVFCIKANSKVNNYELGYTVTDKPHDQKNYTWSSDDMFIFINKKK